jgi:hypothetical protein
VAEDLFREERDRVVVPNNPCKQTVFCPWSIRSVKNITNKSAPTGTKRVARVVANAVLFAPGCLTWA